VTYPRTLPPGNRLAGTPGSVVAQDHDDLTNALADVYTELGTAPHGGSADLTARLTAIEASIATNTSAIAAGLTQALVDALLERPASGLETFPARMDDATRSSVTMTSGTSRFTMFTAYRDLAATQVLIYSGGGSAGAGLTTAIIQVHSVAANGDLARLGAITSDTTLFNATHTAYTRSLTSTVNFVKGNRYAAEVLIAGTTMPQLAGAVIFDANVTGNNLAGLAPRVGATATGGPSASYSNASLTNIGIRPYFLFLP
jgi:hypothetical protein